MNFFRTWLLRKHRQRMVRTFFGWLHSQPAYQPVGIGIDRFVTCSPVVDPGEGYDVTYEWTAVGRAMYVQWWKVRMKNQRKDLIAGADAIRRIADSTWWEWTAGSRPAHWRWPKWYREVIRDGLRIWFRESPKFWRRPQRNPSSVVELQQMRKKLSKVRERRYIEPGHVDSLTSFFAVPKGTDDIRMVYDGTKSGLNDVIWVPSFRLPTVNTMLRAIEFDTVMSDFDIGEMFLNFILHETMQSLCGVDLTHFFGEGHVLWERWTRAAMGIRSSPYQAIQAVLVAKEYVMGDKDDPSNAFRWDEVRLNLPGCKNYDPSKPWVSKIRLDDGRIACDLFIYVDDGRVTAPSKDESWKATRQATSRLNSLGIQDAARKQRWGTRKPGAWAGSIVETRDEAIVVRIDEEKWTKTKLHIHNVIQELKTSTDGTLDRKGLEQKRGFLIYVSRTYPSMTPYLKGLHLTIDGWWEHRDVDGWKMNAKEIRKNKRKARPAELNTEPPKRVLAVPRLEDDLNALQQLTLSDNPPDREVRSKNIQVLLYGFGDASATGSCCNFQKATKRKRGYEFEGRIHYRYGHWCTAISEESSNYRELLNLVEGLELQVREGLLKGSEVFLFTDNSTAEKVYYKGNSSSRKLFELVLRLRRLELHGGLMLHVVHVAGTRMILQGADGGSRGDLNQGVMSGEEMLNFVPLHKSALDQSSEVRDWIEDWWNPSLGTLQFLDPVGWFTEGHKDGNFVWTPPPAAGDVVADQLGDAILKRPYNYHIVVIPTLMTGTTHGVYEARHCWKNWSSNCVRCGSWIERGAGVFCGNFSSARGTYPACQKAWCGECYTAPVGSPFPVRLAKDEDGFDAPTEGDDLRFKQARNGDFLITPFQCELCHFRNIHARNPDSRNEKDIRCMEDFRHANLNAFWAREPSTVQHNFYQARKMEEIGEEWYGFNSVSPPMGPFPLRDTFGMKAACVLLRRSLDPGRHERTIQFSTARKLRSAFSNAYHASKEVGELAAMAYESAKTYATTCPTYGYWFERFILGCHKRMGDFTVSDYALSKAIFVELLMDLESDYAAAGDDQQLRDDVVEFANLLLLGYLNGLQGEEIVKVDLGGLLKHLDEGARDEHPHVPVPLLGRLKGETGEKYHIIPMARLTKSGIEAGKWADRLALLNLRKGRMRGFVFVDDKGKQAKIGSYDPEFHRRLERVQARRKDLFESGVNVADAYGLFRSLRRGSTSEAINSRVPQEVIDLNNRWRKIERARGRNPTMTMSAHYTELKLVIASRRSYSFSF